MWAVSLLIVFLSYGAAKAQSETSTPGFCTREQQGTLETRVNHADVVITGTVIRVETEHLNTGEIRGVDGETERPDAAEERAGSQTVGLVKLWLVVKGSLQQVANHTSGPSELLSYEAMRTPVVKLYGLWNDQLCGSYLTTGDTRIFFLKKFPDFRDLAGVIKNSFENTRSFAAPVLVPSDLHTGNETMTATGSGTPDSTIKPAKKKKKDRKKNKGGKKKKKQKGRRNNKKKKNGMTTKGGKKPRKRVRHKKKRKRSESVYGQLLKLVERPKRSVTLVREMSRIDEQQVKVRRGAAEIQPRSVLVLYSPPARITLANLNRVEEIAKTARP